MKTIRAPLWLLWRLSLGVKVALINPMRKGSVHGAASIVIKGIVDLRGCKLSSFLHRAFSCVQGRRISLADGNF